MTVGALSFLYPWILLGLIALPVIWWLLRVTPPRPRRIAFPALSLLLGLEKKEETSAQTPIWLLLLRMLILSLLIFAFAGPYLNRGKTLEGDGPLVVIMDNGWGAAAGWDARVNAINEMIIQAGQQDRSVLLVPTADISEKDLPLSVLAAEQASEQLRALEPKPWRPDYIAALEAVESVTLEQPQIVWVSDNLAHEGNGRFSDQLQQIGTLRVLVDQEDPLLLSRVKTQDASMRVAVTRPRAGEEDKGDLAIAAADGTVIGAFPFSFAAGETQTEVLIDLPLRLRNNIGRISVRGQPSAGATVLLDDAQQRRSVGLVTSSDQEDEQPLLSDTYYLRRAIDPYAEIVDGSLGTLVGKEISVLILSDIGQIVGNDLSAVEKWVNQGGVLIRFAGPRLAAKRDRLIPVNLRDGGRAFGGALSWESPQKLKPFDANSPFSGIPIGGDVEVRRQVLAEPSIELAGRTWAQLEDGTPLVTAAQRGDGWIILVHVTANSNWSNLPLSGMFVEMLRKMINISAAIPSAASSALNGGAAAGEADRALMPLRVLDGFGISQDPSSSVLPLRTSDPLDITSDHPPGIYAQRSLRLALNIGDTTEQLVPLGNPGGITPDVLEPPDVLRLKPWLLSAAIIFLLIDWLAIIWMFGQRRGLKISPQPSTVSSLAFVAAIAATFAVLHPHPVMAEEENKDRAALAATLETRLAYVITGNDEVDRLSEAGLQGLGRILSSRTAVEPGVPIGVDLENDELAFFPLLFWPIAEQQKALSPEALAKVDAYMKNGGTIFFDTRDQQKNILPELNGGGSPGRQKLSDLIGGLDIPPLMPLNEEHVLTKSFYLLNTFPGRWAGGRVWVEAQNEVTGSTQASNDGVSSIIIGSNDWAAAWAQDENGRPVAAVVPGGARQRELAMRFGVNLVMYALTGNYKADSVHIPALLERLGQ